MHGDACKFTRQKLNINFVYTFISGTETTVLARKTDLKLSIRMMPRIG